MAQSRVPRPGESGPANDPREREDWFRSLDPDARDVVRARWVTEQVKDEEVARFSWIDLRRVVLEGTSVFAAAEVALGFSRGLHAGSLALALLVGACVGLAWWRFQAGIGLSPLIAAPAYAVLQSFVPHEGAGYLFDVLAGLVLVGMMSAYPGFLRGMPSSA